jgi:hypothetical protein
MRTNEGEVEVEDEDPRDGCEGGGGGGAEGASSSSSLASPPSLLSSSFASLFGKAGGGRV